MKSSASDSALMKSAMKDKPIATGTLGKQPEEEEPEFYRSDLLNVLEEKTKYMTLYLEAQDEIVLLQEQLARCGGKPIVLLYVHGVSNSLNLSTSTYKAVR